MRSTHTFGIDFITRKCKEDKKKAFIYIRITVDEERKEISLKEQIIAASWDSKREMVKGKRSRPKQLIRLLMMSDSELEKNTECCMMQALW
ncbi:MAG TPA: Arm DNA-binding domain-containing protein [Chitinophagaceae bacterium]